MRGSALALSALVAACTTDGPPAASSGNEASSGALTSADGPDDDTTGGKATTDDDPDSTGDDDDDDDDESSGDETGEPEPTSRGHDLDGDGSNDTDLSIAACPDDPAATCLIVDSDVTPTTSVLLWNGTPDCSGNLHGTPLGVLGDHEGSALHEVHAAACASADDVTPPRLAVVDVDAATVVASATAPAAQIYAWVEVARDPAGLGHPVLAPSYSDGDYPGGNWGTVCAYRPDLAASPACGGDGFVALGVGTPAPYFREVGGTMQDLDGDGWDDLNLVFHQTIASVSIATLGDLGALTFDVAAADEPGSPVWFHSGRNYGSHAAFTSDAGTNRLLIVGGAPVGTFSDDLCNVSRFLAMLEAPAGQPGARTLAWSRYYGFSSTIFATYDPQYVSDPFQDVARLADVVDDCIHRFADSRSTMDGEAVVVIDYFDMDAPISYCLDEQFALYQDPAWTDEKAEAWYECFGANVAAPGRWGMQVVRESDGVGLTGAQELYVWGWTDTVLPGGEVVYLVEQLPGVGAFDLSDREPSELQLWALVDGLFQPRASAPVAGRPKIFTAPPRPELGQGAFSYTAELTLADRDRDGLDEIQLDDDQWIGWDDVRGSMVLK